MGHLVNPDFGATQTKGNAKMSTKTKSNEKVAEVAETENETKTETVKKKFKRGKALVLQSYSIKNKKEGIPFYIQVDSIIVSKNQLKKDGSPDTDEDGKPKILHLCKVTDLETGETGEMVLPFMIERALKPLSDEGKLVNMKFELTRGKTKGRTNEWSVYEVE